MPRTLGPIDILVICTGNICRSPMAEALLRHRLEAHGVRAHVASTGLTFDGKPATEEAAEVLARQGIDLSAHRSRTMTEAQLQGVDLVLGMERKHVREVYLLAPTALQRSFTLPEFVRRAMGVGPCHGDLHGWIGQVAAGRRPADLVGESADDEVADPYGQPLAFYERTAAQLDHLCTATADLLAGRQPTALVAAAVGASAPTEAGVGEPRATKRSRFWRR